MGIFWDETIKRRKESKPLFLLTPETNWRPPKDFPNLSSATAVAVDCETYDPQLLTHGPGWARGNGHIVGVSLAVPEGHVWYFPMRHEMEGEYNMDAKQVLNYLADTLSNPRCVKIGANLIYDYGWLTWEGVSINGHLIDVQFNEALLTETGSVSLDTLGKRYLGQGKETNLLYEWSAKCYGGIADQSQRKNIYRCSPRLVGPYAEQDAILPIKIAILQWKRLKEQSLLSVADLENSLIPLLVAMRSRGVRVDIDKAEQLKTQLQYKVININSQIKNIAGMEVNVNASESIKKAFDKAGLPTMQTEKGNHSFDEKILKSIDHPLTKLILDARKYQHVIGTFIDAYILAKHVDGRLYTQFHPLRSQGKGTRSGRFSSATPNLQNIPSRNEELAPLIRGLFVPDYGHKQWRRYDYSQIEYRMFLHFAVGQGAQETRDFFVSHPETDYHDKVLDMIASNANWDISTPELRKAKRKPVKNINFGLLYGMGIYKFAGMLGITNKEAEELFNAYHNGVPFAKSTLDVCSKQAQETGIITTILGRKAYFDLWVKKGKERTKPLPLDAALRQYGHNIERHKTYAALNRRLQGSAADLLKKAMSICWHSGLFSKTTVPRLTVHDELDFSDPGDCEKEFKEIQRVMENAISLRVPVKVDGDIGANWGET